MDTVKCIFPHTSSGFFSLSRTVFPVKPYWLVLPVWVTGYISFLTFEHKWRQLFLEFFSLKKKMLLPLVYSFVNLSKTVFWSFQATFSYTKETRCQVCSIFLGRIPSFQASSGWPESVHGVQWVLHFPRCVSGGRPRRSPSQGLRVSRLPSSCSPPPLFPPSSRLSSRPSLSGGFPVPTSALHPPSLSAP